MNFTKVENKIKKLISEKEDLEIDEIEKFGESKLSVVILFKNVLMGSIEYVMEKSLDLMIFDVETNSIQYSITIEFADGLWNIDKYLSDFFNEFKKFN